MFKRIIIILNYLGGGIALPISMKTNITNTVSYPKRKTNMKQLFYGNTHLSFQY